MKYCRRCDLGFCPRHEKDHVDDPTHELVEDSRVQLCCVCVGIYAPIIGQSRSSADEGEEVTIKLNLESPKKPKLYISGPISLGGTSSPEEKAEFMQLFSDLEKEASAYFEVFNPCNIPQEGTGWVNCMKECIQEVCDSDLLVTLPRWFESRGASLEVYIACQLKIPILSVETFAEAMVEYVDARH